MNKKILLTSGLVLTLLLMQVVGQPTLPISSSMGSTIDTINRQAPTPIVNVTFGTYAPDYASDVVECSGGGFALAGITTSYGVSSDAGWLIRTDAAGNHLWNYTYDGSSADGFRSVIQCSDGGFAMVGYTYSYGVAGIAIWLVKTDANGNHLWNKTIDEVNDQQGYDLVEVSTGGFALAGWTHRTPNQKEFYLVKTDASGNHQWNETFGDIYDDEAYSIIETNAGGFLLTGYHLKEIPPPGVPSSSSRFIVLESDLYAVCTNSLGALVWDKIFDSGEPEYGISGVECPNGDFAFGGFIDYGAGDRDFWLIRTTSGVVHLWNETYGYSGDDEVLHAMILYSSGGFVISGTTNHTPLSDNDLWVVRVADDGTHLWNETFGSWDSDQSCYGLADCSLGIAVYGTPHTLENCYQGWLIVIPDDVAPAWNPAPADKTVLFGEPFSYDLNATDPWPLTWVINDTTNFAINQDGVVTNAIALAAGIYALRVTVSDPAGNDLIGTFLVTVTAPALSPLLLYIGIAVVAIIVVCLIIYFIRRSRESK